MNHLLCNHNQLILFTSFLCTGGDTDFHSASDPVYWSFTHASVDSVLSWVVLLLFRLLNHLGTFSRVVSLFVNSYTVSWKYSTFFCTFLLFFHICISIHFWWFLIVQWRCKIDFNVSIENTNGIILIFWFNFHDVNFKFIIKDRDCYSVAFMETSEVS